MANPRSQRDAICSLIQEPAGRGQRPLGRIWPADLKRGEWRFLLGGRMLRFQGISEPDFGGLRWCRERVAVFCADDGARLPSPPVSDNDLNQITRAVFLRRATAEEFRHTELQEAVVEMEPAEVSPTRVVFQLTGRVALFNNVISSS